MCVCVWIYLFIILLCMYLCLKTIYYKVKMSMNNIKDTNKKQTSNSRVQQGSNFSQ